MANWLAKERLPVELISPQGKEKVVRATPRMHKFERDEVFLPKYDNAFRQTFEAELLAWTGTDSELCDQIDAAAYAALVMERELSDPIVLQWPGVR